MANFYETVLDVLKQDRRFFAKDGTFLRNAVYEAAMQMDADLIKLLLSDEEAKKRFFKEVDGVQVFDKVGFGWVINNRQFLPDSYTRFKNKIGLGADSGELISNTGKVELVFPYKDSVLEGGQTKEEQNRKEVFFNETLAQDEVDRLLYPKVLTRATRVCGVGEHDLAGRYQTDTMKIVEEACTDYNDDNLIIRGNNLLALSSLLKRFAGMVQCIYIDPPYNTGSDSFGYNDSFNHSSWLTFMRNRLVIARQLLNRSGMLFISVDDNESAYLKVLCDEIFGNDNFMTTIAYERSGVSGLGQGGGFLVNTHESIICYAKEKSMAKVGDLSGEYPFGYDEMKRYNKILVSPGESAQIDSFEAPSTHEEVIIRKHSDYEIKTISLRDFDNRRLDIEKEYLQYFDKVYRNTSVQAENEFQNNILQRCGEGLYSAEYTVSRGRRKGERIIAYYYNQQVFAWLKDSAMIEGSQIVKTNKLSDFWSHGSIPKADLANEGGVSLRRGKKPENLLKRILDISTEDGDLVLDFFLGSGTTAAVAHKMNRRYIGVEQLDYGDNDVYKRLCNVIKGEPSGISKKTDWRGGGTFVYCELAKLNQNYVDEIEAATDEATVDDILARILRSGFISYKIDPKAITEADDDYNNLSIEDKKRFLMEILDKNLLYVNYCDIDDEEFGIPDEDKAFTRSFYREG